MDVDIRGKRKKKKNLCPNPLFVKWLTQWRDDAAERGMKSQYTYNKALSSLKKYPLPFSSGKECKVLENIGDKICKMLDTKLAEHIAEYGVPSADSPPKKVPKAAVPKRTTSSVSGTAQRPAKHKTPASVTNNSAHSISDNEDNPQQPKQRRRNHSSGEYVPAYRSGPYALLLTLYSSFQRGSGVGHLSKADFMREAQRLSDASFTIADPGSRYTAWSSMGNLIRKGLVIKEGSPARYSITQAGCDLAEKLKQVGETTHCSTDLTLGVSAEDHQPPALPSLAVIASPPQVTSLPHMSSHLSEGITVAKESERFCYWYVTEDGSTTVDKNKAAVTVDDSIGLGFLIKCNYQELLKSGKRYKLDISRPFSDDNMFAYLQDSNADDFARLPNKGPAVDSSKSEPKKDVSTVQAKRTVTELQTETRPNNSSCNLPAVGSCLSERLGLSCKPPTGLPSNTDDVGTKTALGQVTDRMLDISPRFSFRPGTFDVVLCVDNQEFYGKTSSGGKTLLADLIKNGVNCDVRKLQVGDFLWVAREKIPPVLGQLGRTESRELVLDHIIERKRMDDLVSSCIDGRFREQKFRLKQCGLRCPLYLIEDYGSVQNFSMPEDRLKQTMANTQVVDGFQVKRTRDNKESVAYLTIMTRYLQSFYQSKTLHCYPADLLADISGPYDINHRELKLMEFKEFNEASVKTKNLCIREMFGKQMIQMYRLSAEGARAVLDHYPTPSHLIAAYDNCRSEKDKEELLSKIKSGKAGRCLGSASSRQIYQLYCTNQPLS